MSKLLILNIFFLYPTECYFPFLACEVVQAEVVHGS